MKNGVLLRQVINVIDEVDFNSPEDRHSFNDIYEKILKDIQNAGNSGEFYTPRAATDFIAEVLNPKTWRINGRPCLRNGRLLDFDSEPFK